MFSNKIFGSIMLVYNILGRFSMLVDIAVSKPVFAYEIIFILVLPALLDIVTFVIALILMRKDKAYSISNTAAPS